MEGDSAAGVISSADSEMRNDITGEDCSQSSSISHHRVVR